MKAFAQLENFASQTARRFRYLWRLCFRPDLVRIDGVRIAVAYRNWSSFMVRRVISENYESCERGIVAAALRPDDRVLEIGGGIGLIALTARTIVKDDDIVVYEANPALIDNIKKNFTLNGAEINVVNAAVVSDNEKAEKTSFFLHEDFWAGGLRDHTAGMKRIVVQAAKLSEIIAAHRANVVIMDVEGAECDILRTARLEGVDLLCLELHPQFTGQGDASAAIRRLLNLGFEIDLNRSRGEIMLFARPGRWACRTEDTTRARISA